MSRLWIVLSRNYTRWSSRTPVKVYYPEFDPNNAGEDSVVDLSSKSKTNELKYSKQEIRKEKENFFKRQNKSPNLANRNNSIDLKKVDKLTYYPKGQNKTLTTLTEKPKRLSNYHLEKVTKVGDKNVYTKLSNNDPDIGNLLIKLKSTKHRLKSDLILVEGRRMIHDALVANAKLEKLIFSRTQDFEIIRPFMNDEARAYKMSYKEIQQWSDLDTCPGLIAVFKKPNPFQIKVSTDRLPIQVVCDNVRDPNNLGAILRAAVGIGCKNVLLTKGCVDLWNPKTIRSGSGAHFQIPVYNKLDWKQISERCSNSVIYIADNNIFVKQEDEKYFQENRVDEKEIDEEESAHETSDDEDSDDKVSEEDVKRFKSEITSIPYYSANFLHSNPIVLIIGGETEGISRECYRFGFDNKATCLNIPLMNGVESLNVGMALAVIAFEMKKQLLLGSAEKQEVLSNIT